MEIGASVAIGEYSIMDEYNPDSLEDNTKIFDQYLQTYHEAYLRAGIHVKHFADVDEFAANYLRES